MIARCFDYRRIKKFLGCDLVVSSEVFYLIEQKDGVDLGVWTIHGWRDGAIMHVSMGTECRGKAAVTSGKAALKWIFDNTDFHKIYAKTSNKIRESQFGARWIGMECVHADETHRYYKVEV